MTDNEKKRELALYRLKQADETLDEAIFLQSAEKSSRAVVNRVYYAMFYAVLALLVFEDFSSSKHSGVISYFNKNFTKKGVLSSELGQSINIAFELRQRGDYKEFSDLAHEQVKPLIPRAEEFVIAVREYLRSNNKI